VKENAERLSIIHFSSEMITDLADVFLHEFRADDANETRVRSVSNGSCTQRLPSAGRSKQQNTLRRVNAQVHKPLRLQTFQRIFHKYMITSKLRNYTFHERLNTINTHRRCRHNSTVELSLVGVGDVNRIHNWLMTTADGCVHSADTTQLDFAVGKFVQTRQNCRQLVANSTHTVDANQLHS